jgi:hypothetical protein
VLQRVLLKGVEDTGKKKKRTVKVEIIHPSYIRLRLAANETNTLVLTAITRLRLITALNVRHRMYGRGLAYP